MTSVSPQTPLRIAEGLTPVTIGQLFPADDLVAQWVFALSAVVEDLAVADTQLHRALRDESNGASTFHYRVLVSRVFEARRVVIVAEEHRPIQDFLRESPKANAEFSVLRRLYVPRDGAASRVDALYALVRHRTVHHAFPGSDELRDALEASSDLEAFYVLDHDEGTSHFVWAELVAISWLFGRTDDPANVTRAREAVQLARKIVVSFTTMLRWVVEAHCARRGVKHEQLIRHCGQPPAPTAGSNRAARRRAARDAKRKP
jgi:hypothetical protein